MKNFGQYDESPATRFRAVCEQQGLRCELVLCSGRKDRFNSRMLLVEGQMVRLSSSN